MQKMLLMQRCIYRVRLEYVMQRFYTGDIFPNFLQICHLVKIIYWHVWRIAVNSLLVGCSSSVVYDIFNEKSHLGMRVGHLWSVAIAQ